MITGKTATGFEFEIKEDTLNDWELFEALSEIDEGSNNWIKVAKRLFHDGGKAVKEHCRNENGTVEFNKVVTEIVDIFRALRENRNVKN